MAVFILLITIVSGQSQAPTSPPDASFTGAGSCASSNCHGSVWPRTGGRIPQNEYYIWSTRDRHSKAYQALLGPESRQIAKNLKIEAPETAALCLNCHSTNAPGNQRASTFDVADGVTCESCHGPASNWLGPHTTRGWTHEQSVKLGMIDTKDVRKRLDVCLSCHLGDSTKTVDHELIAAGHPDLVFELETFSALMPAHWNREKESMSSVQRWAAGQASTLRASMEQFERRINGKAWDAWPEFADFECASCHHNLVLPSSRQQRGFIGRAGAPAWNEAHYVVFRHLLTATSQAERTRLDDAVRDLRQLAQTPLSSRQKLAAAAGRIAQIARDAATPAGKQPLDPQSMTKLLQAISGDASNIAFAGIRAAEQATMSIDVLYNILRPGRPNDAVNAQIQRLYDLLQSQARYNPEEFAAQLRQIGRLL